MLHLSSPRTGGRMEMTKENESQESDLCRSVRVSGITLRHLARHLGLGIPGIGHRHPLERDEILMREQG